MVTNVLTLSAIGKLGGPMLGGFWVVKEARTMQNNNTNRDVLQIECQTNVVAFDRLGNVYVFY